MRNPNNYILPKSQRREHHFLTTGEHIPFSAIVNFQLSRSGQMPLNQNLLPAQCCEAVIVAVRCAYQ